MLLNLAKVNKKYLKGYLKGNDVSFDSKAERSSEQTNTHRFCPRSSCSHLKQAQSEINIRMQACASPVGAGDAGGSGGAGGAEGAGGVCKR